MKNLSTIIIASVISVIGLFVVGSALQEDEATMMDSLALDEYVQDTQVRSLYSTQSNIEESETVEDNTDRTENNDYLNYDDSGNSNEMITKITMEQINLMSEADDDAPILSVIPKGTPVQLYEDCDCEWVCIAYNNHYGYVNSTYLYKTDTSVDDINKDKLPETAATKQNNIYQHNTTSTHNKEIPAGATAICNDGTFSFSAHRQGTCSWHGGVAKWLK